MCKWQNKKLFVFFSKIYSDRKNRFEAIENYGEKSQLIQKLKKNGQNILRAIRTFEENGKNKNLNILTEFFEFLAQCSVGFARKVMGKEPLDRNKPMLMR